MKILLITELSRISPLTKSIVPILLFFLKLIIFFIFSIVSKELLIRESRIITYPLSNNVILV